MPPRVLASGLKPCGGNYIWRGIAYVWYPMTFPATCNMHKLIYVTDTIGWSRVQPSLLGKARGTERAAEIEPKGRRAGWVNLRTSEDNGIGSFPIHGRSVTMKNGNKILSFLRVTIVPLNFKDLKL